MAFITVNFWGESLQKGCSMNVLLPDRVAARGKLPVLYELHGLSDDHSGWMRWSSIEDYVRDLPLIVVMPDGGRGFYCDAAEGFAYESHILKDVIGFVERFFPARRARDARAVGGLSMGGYGAMKLALKYPNKFCSVVSHSSAFEFAHRPMMDSPEFQRILGARTSGGPDDVYALAEKLEPADAPAIRFDCGVDDGLIDSNRSFHRHLRRLKIKHQYREFPGGHNWRYWDEHIQQAIRFHWKHLTHPA